MKLEAVVQQLKARHPEWLVKAEQPASINIGLSHIGRSLAWRTANKTWSAVVNELEDDAVERTDDIITYIVSDTSNPETNVERVATNIAVHTERFLKEFETIAAIDLDALTERCFKAAIEAFVRGNAIDAISDLWKPVLEAFPALETRDSDFGQGLGLRDSVDAACDVLASLAEDIRQSIRDWLSINISRIHADEDSTQRSNRNCK